MKAFQYIPRAWHATLHRILATTTVVAIAMGMAYCGLANERERKYPFPTVPRSILERLGEIKLGEPAVVDSVEWEILEDAWARRDSPDTEKQTPEYDRLVVRLMLTASGVVTEAAQEPYIQKLNTLIADARLAIDKGKPDAHPGESLIQFLHAGVMHGGYELSQSSFAAVFDSGIYNCVSSTAMYFVIGRKLGLKMQIISIPGGSFLSGHACLNLIEGDRIYEVEPTNPNGFDWGTKLSQPGVFTIGFQPDRKDGHIVDGIGLAATIYSNRGVDASKAENHDRLAAASLGLRALMCDPYDSTSAQNVLAVFTNWGPVLAAEGRYDEAIRTLAFGYEVTQDGGVKNNLSITASEQIASLLNDQKDIEAKAAIEHAATMLPEDNDFKNAEPWIRHASKSYDDEGGEAALAAIERAIVMTSEKNHLSLCKYRTSLFRRWSQDLLTKSDANGSVSVLVRGYKINPSDEDLSGGIAFHTQEALGFLDNDGADPAAAVTHVNDLVAKFPTVKVIAEFASAHVYRTLATLREQKKFAESLSAAKIYEAMPSSTGEPEQFIAQAWCDWAEFYFDQMKFDEAIEKYVNGLKSLPGNERLMRGLAMTALEQITSLLKDKHDREAQAAIDRGATLMPNDGNFKNAEPWIRYIFQCYEDEGGEGACNAVERAFATTNENDHMAIMTCRTSLLRRWSQYLLGKSDVDGSVNVLARGFAMNPSDEDLRSGIAYHTQEALDILDKAGADPAAAVAHLGVLKRTFPAVETVTEVALAHARRSIDSISDGGRFSDAIAAAGVYSRMIDSTEDPRQLVAQGWESWAEHFSEQKKWVESIEKFVEGLKVLPGDERLINGAVRAVDDWADEAMTLKDWGGAITVYDRGLKYFPENEHLINNRQYCREKKAERDKDAEK